MKNQIKFKSVLLGSVLMAVALCFAIGAFPGDANASGYSCPNPRIESTTGFYSCPLISSAPQLQYYQLPQYYQPPQYYQQPQYSPLSVSCYTNNSGSVTAGTAVQWYATASGGNGGYTYSWSGTDGLVGSGQSTYMTYYNPGAKTATITVYSAGQSASMNCTNSVTVYNNTYVGYQQPYYNTYNTNYYSPVSATCVANTSYTPLGTAVTWSASAVGGSGYYTYSWSGTDGISGQGQSLYYNYRTPGTKYASVTVYSNGQTITEPCTSVVSVGVPNVATYNYGNTGYLSSNNNGLDVGCYSDPSTATPNQPITWSVEVTGGAGPYTYSWTGTDGLSGSQAQLIKYYSTSGTKTAVVSVTSADGRSNTHACSTAVAVKSVAVTPSQPKPVTNVTNNTVNNNDSLGAAALFSLNNIPWGWVAILVILVLFATVMYLLFNRPKI